MRSLLDDNEVTVKGSLSDDSALISSGPLLDCFRCLLTLGGACRRRQWSGARPTVPGIDRCRQSGLCPGCGYSLSVGNP